MEGSGVDNNGVFMLITELCRTIRGSAQDRGDATDVSKYRKDAYEILLYSKLNKTVISKDIVNNELLHQKFRAKISADNNEYMEERCERLKLCEEIVEKAKEHFSETNGSSGNGGVNIGLGMLYTMLKLSEIEPNKNDNNVEEDHDDKDDDHNDNDLCQLLAPSPFNLFCNFEEAEKYYPDTGYLKILHPKPKFFKGVETPECDFYEYKTKKFSFCIPSNDDTDNWLDSLHTKHSCTDIFSMRFLEDNIGSEQQNVWDASNITNDALQESAKKQVIRPSKVTETKTEEKTQKTAIVRDSQVSAWESFQCEEGAPHICSFISDKNYTFLLKEYNENYHGRVFEPRIMSLTDFIQDLKWLAIGIVSETFEHDNNNVFTMVKNVTVEGLLPETLQKYAEPFLDCGTRFKQLETMTNRMSTKDCTEGFAYKGICNAIAEYLKVFKLFVLAQNTNLLIDFYMKMEDMMQQMIAFSNVINKCGLNEYDGKKYDKGGAHLINYIWQEIKNCTKDEFISLLIFMLKSMCESYYRHLQQWIYHGILDDPHNELFICYVDDYPEKTKCYFENAYFVKIEAVPGFLSGCEQAILNCGKYTKLLRSFKSNHPLFDLACPEFQLCLDDDDLEQVTNACELYYEKASKFCQRIDMNMILEERAAAKQNRKVAIKNHMKKLFKAWEEEKFKSKQILLEKKAFQHNQLRMQQKDDLQRKLDARVDIIVNEQLVQAQLAKLEDEILNNDSINIRARIKYLRCRKEWLKHDIQEATDQIERSLPLQRAERKAFIARETAAIVEKGVKDSAETKDYLNLNRIPTYKRSDSDIINSNVPTTTDLENNTIATCVQLNTDNASSSISSSSQQQTKKPLSEAQRNKLRVLTEEYMISMPTTVKSDINLNTLPPESTELSDLQRNRQHMMQTDLFCEYNRTDDLQAQRIKEHLVADTELARNRRRVLNSEYNIISPTTSKTYIKRPTTTEEALQEEEYTLRKTPIKIIDIVETDLERNRRRVLLSEFNIISPNHNEVEIENENTTTIIQNKRKLNIDTQSIADSECNSLEEIFSSGILIDCNSSDDTLLNEQTSSDDTITNVMLNECTSSDDRFTPKIQQEQANLETELERNRRRIMGGSEYNILSHSDALEIRKTKSNLNLAATNRPDLMDNQTNISDLEEKSSSGILADFVSIQSISAERVNSRDADAEAELQMPPKISITDFERNRQRVLGSEYNIIIPTNLNNEAAKTEATTNVIDKKPSTAKLGTTHISDTELTRNRRQVMDSKYNILTGGMDTDVIGHCNRTRNKPANLQLIQLQPVIAGDSEAAAAATPMSTTSDTSLATIYEECNNEILDVRNNNNKFNESINEDDSMPKNNIIESDEIGENIIKNEENTTNSNSILVEDEEEEEAVVEHNDINCKNILKPKLLTKPIIEFNINATDCCSSTTSCATSSLEMDWNEITTLLHTKSNALELLSKVSLLFQEQFNADVDDDANNFKTDNSDDAALLPYKKVCKMLQQNFQLSEKSDWLRFGNVLLAAENETEIEKEPKLDIYELRERRNITIKQNLQRCIMLPLQTHFSFVRNEVMRIFIEDLKIYEQFHSLRNYFFLMDGEFCELIVAGIIGQLDDGVSPQKLLNYETLHGLLYKAINKSTTGATKYSEKLSFIVGEIPESFKHTSPDVLNMLSLSYNVAWPLNIILNTDTLERYSIVFQYLFKVRRISYLYERAFCCLNDKSLPQKLILSMQYRKLTFIRHKFMHFITTLQNYLTTVVLLSSWNKFKNALRAVDSVETLYQTHVQYLKRVTFLCLLNRKSFALRESIDKILKIILRFYKVLTSEKFQLDTKTNEYTHSRYQRLIYEDTEFEKFRKYTIYLGNKVVRRGYQEEIRQFIDVISFDDHFK